MKVADSIRPLRTLAPRRPWSVEPLEERLLLSGGGDVFGARKAKYTEADGDKVQLSISGKQDTFDVIFDRAGGSIVGISQIVLHGTDPTAQLNFSLKAPKKGGSDMTTFVDSIVCANPALTLQGINATNASISNVDLTGSLVGSFSTNRDLGNLTVQGTLNSVVIQAGHDLTGNITAAGIGKVTATGGDLLGNITSTSSITSVQGQNMAGNLTAATSLSTLTLAGDLSGDVSFTRDTLKLLISGNLTPSASITANADSGTANIDAGDLGRLGVIGSFGGTIMADGNVGLGVGGDLLAGATVQAGTDSVLAGNLVVSARTIASNLAASGDVTFAMANGGFAGTVMAGDDVLGNGANDSIVIRGGDFTGTLIAGQNPNNLAHNLGGDIAPMNFLPTSGGFSGAAIASGTVNTITTSFFSSSASVTGSQIGDLNAIRGNAGDAIASGAIFTATTGSIGNVTAKAIGSVAIAGTFVAAQNIGNVTATSTGNVITDHAISEASFTATAGTIGAVVASAKGGSGINDSTFTAQTSMGNITSSAQGGHGFRSSADGQNVFTVLDGDMADVTGSSILGDGFHGATFIAHGNIVNITGTSSSGNGIGDSLGLVGTYFTAIGGGIASITGSATGGAAANGGDGIVHTTVVTDQNASGIGIGALEGSSQFGTGISQSRFTTTGNFNQITGTTNNSNPTVDEDGIFGSVFHSGINIGQITAHTAVAGGAGVGSGIQDSLFSSKGSFAPLPPGSSGSGAVVVDGGDRDDHGFADPGLDGIIGTPDDVNRDGWRFIEQMVKFAHDNSGIGGDKVLVIGASAFAQEAIQSSATVLGLSLTTVTGSAISTADFSQYALIYVPSDMENVGGGINNTDLALLTARKADIPAYVNSGGSLVALTESNVAGTPYGWLELPQVLTIDTFGAGGTSEHLYQTPALAAAGLVITDQELNNGTPWHNSFTGPPGFNGLVPFVQSVGADNAQGTADDRVVTLGLAPGSVWSPTVITVTGDVLDSKFMAGYDIGSDLELDGTAGDAEESAATDPVIMGDISVTGDWINSFATAGITTMDPVLGDGDDALAAPGSSMGMVTVSSNIAGDVANPGNAPLNNFQSDSIEDMSADAFGIDPNSGSVPAPIGVSTHFSNGVNGSIGNIIAETSTQAEAIGSGSVFHAGSSIASISVVNDTTTFAMNSAIGAATFEAETWIGNITAHVDQAPSASAINQTIFRAHGSSEDTGLAIGNIEASVQPFRNAIVGALFDASEPTVAGTPLHIGTIQTAGDIFQSDFLATGNIANGELFEGDDCPNIVSPGPLVVTETTDEDDLVNRLFSDMIPAGITINDVNLVAHGDPAVAGSSSAGLFQGFPSLPVGSAAQLPDGIILASGRATNALGPNDSPSEDTDLDADGDTDLDGLLGGTQTTNDATSLSITFTNDSSVQSISALFVFASEEFAEFVNSSYNDIFAVFLDGVNISNDPNGNILNVNNNFFLLNNTDVNPPLDFNDDPISGTTLVDLPDLQYDGITPVLRVSTLGVLTPGQHTIKFAIADVGDNAYDSGVFIAQLCASSQPGQGGTDIPTPSEFGIEVTGNIAETNFIADSDLNASGSIAGIGGIHVLPSSGEEEGETSDNGQIGNFNVTAPVVFKAGSNDPTSGLAIGNITVDGPDIVIADTIVLYAMDSAVFEATNDTALNIGTITTSAGSIGSTTGFNTSFTATGDIRDITATSVIAVDSSFIADSDDDGSGDVGDVAAAAISDTTIHGVNVAVSAGIIIGASADNLDVTASGGSIGDFIVGHESSVARGATDIRFSAGDSIGNVEVNFTNADEMSFREAFSNSQFFAGQLVPTGGIGDITVANTSSENDFGTLISSSFSAGSGGIGDISVTTSSLGFGVVDSVFRAAGVVDITHAADIGNITVVTNPTDGGPNQGVVDTIFSALGSIGTGLGNEDMFNISIHGNVVDSRILAGYDIGNNLMFDGDIGFSDDSVASAIVAINAISMDALVIRSDIIAGVNPVNDHFGDSDDVVAVIGSSLGSVALSGEVVFVPEDPLADRTHLIAADLIGEFDVAGQPQLTVLPGFLDAGNGANNVNVRVM